MLKMQTGTSTNANAALAGKEAAEAVKADLKDMKMAFVYSGVQYDQKTMLHAIKETLPGVPLIGNTSFTGVMTQEGFVSSDDGFVGIMAVSDPDMTVGVAGMAKQGSARETGHKVAEAALKNAGKTEAPAFFYMSAPSGEEEYYLKGITEVIGRVPFFGGSAADNAIAGEWLLYTDENVYADGISVAFFYTDKAFANVFTGAYRETTNVGVITNIVGDRTLAEINGIPALEQYRAWTGASAEDVKGGNLLAYAIQKPLGVKDPLGDLIAVRHPMNGNDDGSMNIGNNLAELEAKIGAPIAGLHLVHCGGRRAGIGDRINEVYDQVKAAVGDIPFLMEYTFGEYGYEDDGRNTCGGLMLSFTAFGK